MAIKTTVVAIKGVNDNLLLAVKFQDHQGPMMNPQENINVFLEFTAIHLIYVEIFQSIKVLDGQA